MRVIKVLGHTCSPSPRPARVERGPGCPGPNGAENTASRPRRTGSLYFYGVAPRERGDTEIVRGLTTLGSTWAYVGSLQTLRALLYLELHLLAFGKGTVPLLLDGGVMDEYVLSSVGLRDEAEALLCVEPLDCSGCHRGGPLKNAEPRVGSWVLSEGHPSADLSLRKRLLKDRGQVSLATDDNREN